MEICSVCVLMYDSLVRGEISKSSNGVLIGQLFIETALLTVKDNSDLLCHSQLDGSQGCVTIIC